MESLLCLLFSFADIFGGYQSGYAIDVQYRHPDGAMPRTVIPRKWKWLFRFKWISGRVVLTESVFIELSGLFTGIAQLVLGFVGLCGLGSPRGIFTVSLLLECLFAYTILTVLAVGGIRYHKNFYKKNLKAPRCWACEWEAQFHSLVPVRKVYVRSHLDTSWNRRYYRISLKAHGGKLFWATADGFDPPDGSVVFAFIWERYTVF